MELNKTYLGDCLEIMKSIPDGYIDMITIENIFSIIFLTQNLNK